MEKVKELLQEHINHLKYILSNRLLLELPDSKIEELKNDISEFESAIAILNKHNTE